MKQEKEPKVVFDINQHGAMLNEIIDDICDNLLQISVRQDMVKGKKADAKKATGIDSKQLTKLIKMRFDQTRERFENENNEVLEIYDAIFKK